ncbi:leucine-rich repeat domain-containing protein [Fusibacter bizertensis]|uniref:Leucine-rich repeat domain-containing protein n=1 Tax=Fusibacter bizertensis TaxID=1488331 RepID=A0ABT6N8Y0_9FIRM|nr:leucine-rich repeat domain-containing protein [Fusibacter bizertensis]MDH8676863.1 leucine-rich repeat domain-containing protein [Fusibacter bizertensis]
MRNYKIILSVLLGLMLMLILSACSRPSEIASDDYFDFNATTGAIDKFYPRGVKGEKDLITNLIVPDQIQGVNVEKISINAFNYDLDLTQIVLSKYITSIEPYAFYGCKNLEKVVMYDQVIEIGKAAFQGCESLESINFSNKLESIGDDAFMNADALKSVILPDSLKQIGERAFWGLNEVEQVDFGNGLESIGKDAFQSFGDDKQKTIVIPQSIKFIGESAFDGVNLKSIYFYPVEVTIEEGEYNSYYDQFVRKLKNEANPSGYYYMDSLGKWVKVPFDVLKTPYDLSRYFVMLIGILYILVAIYLFLGKRRVFTTFWEVIPLCLLYLVLMLGMTINPRGEFVFDLKLTFPSYSIFIIAVIVITIRQKYNYICLNYSYPEVITHIYEYMKSTEIEFQREEEAPGGTYAFILNDKERIKIEQGFGQVSIDMSNVKKLVLHKEIIKMLQSKSNSNRRVRLSLSWMRYLALGILLVLVAKGLY